MTTFLYTYVPTRPTYVWSNEDYVGPKSTGYFSSPQLFSVSLSSLAFWPSPGTSGTLARVARRQIIGTITGAGRFLIGPLSSRRAESSNESLRWNCSLLLAEFSSVFTVRLAVAGKLAAPFGGLVWRKEGKGRITILDWISGWQMRFLWNVIYRTRNLVARIQFVQLNFSFNWKALQWRGQIVSALGNAVFVGHRFDCRFQFRLFLAIFRPGAIVINHQ